MRRLVATLAIAVSLVAFWTRIYPRDFWLWVVSVCVGLAIPLAIEVYTERRK